MKLKITSIVCDIPIDLSVRQQVLLQTLGYTGNKRAIAVFPKNRKHPPTTIHSPVMAFSGGECEGTEMEIKGFMKSPTSDFYYSITLYLE